MRRAVIYESPGARLRRHFWTFWLVVFLIAGLAAISQTLAVVVVIVALAIAAGVGVSRALKRQP
jgi:hypothetical protein